MDNESNYQQPEKKDYSRLIYSILGGALLLSWGFIFFNNKKATETETKLTTEKVAVTTELDDVKDMYSESLFRLDSLIGENESLQQNVSGSNAEIIKLRADISKILSNKKASDADLARARTMIKTLNGKIEGLSMEVDRLQGENQALTSENTVIKQQKTEVETDLARTQSEKVDVETELENTKDVASTLTASDIKILALNDKGGGNEKETTKAKKADKLRINFNLDENRIAQSGNKEIFVVITDPSGKIISYQPGDVFVTRDGLNQLFTSKVSVNYESGKKLPVSYDWKNDKTFTEGNYKIEIYHNGFKIGEQVRSMKKGGLFS